MLRSELPYHTNAVAWGREGTHSEERGRRWQAGRGWGQHRVPELGVKAGWAAGPATPPNCPGPERNPDENVVAKKGFVTGNVSKMDVCKSQAGKCKCNIHAFFFNRKQSASQQRDEIFPPGSK